MKAKLVNSRKLTDILNKLVFKYNTYENIVISCIFKDTKILSFGISKPDNHINNKICAEHAESVACSNLYSKFNKKKREVFGNVDILITRFAFDKNNNDIILKASKPCQFCIKTMNKTNFIQNIYYTDDNKIYKYKFIDVFKNINDFGFSSGDKRIYKYLMK